MVFSTSIRSLNAAIDAALLNFSWRVSRGPPAMDRLPWTPCLAFFAGGGVESCAARSSLCGCYKFGVFIVQARYGSKPPWIWKKWSCLECLHL